MAYPNNDEIAAAAQQYNVDPIVMYAFAAMHERVPATALELQQFQTMVETYAAQTQNRPVEVYGYVQAHGVMPFSVNELVVWLASIGVRTATGGLTGNAPFAGEGYPPGNQPTNPTQPTTSPQQPPPTGGFDLGSLMKNPFVLGGAALVGAYALGIFPRRR